MPLRGNSNSIYTYNIDYQLHNYRAGGVMVDMAIEDLLPEVTNMPSITIIMLNLDCKNTIFFYLQHFFKKNFNILHKFLNNKSSIQIKSSHNHSTIQ